MKSCIYETSFSFLVNESPTKDFKGHRELRQWDPLSSSLFAVVLEGLASMINKVVKIGNFNGFKLNSNVEYRLLQFADDTMIFGEGSWKHLWSLRALLS